MSRRGKCSSRGVEAGAEDIEENADKIFTITTLPQDLESVNRALREAEIETLDSEISLVAETSVSTDLETSVKIYRLLETLEDLDDTQNVYLNADFPEEIIEHLN